MAFRVETSAQAESDATQFSNGWLSQHAGEGGIRWFLALKEAIALAETTYYGQV